LINLKLRGFFEALSRDHGCRKLIAYQGSDIKISVSGSAYGFTMNVNEFSRKKRMITSATDRAKILDDYQYLICEEIRRSHDDPHYVKILTRYRVVIISYFVLLAEIVEQIKIEPNNLKAKKALQNVTRRMTNLIYKLEKVLLNEWD
jgi:hypothetical protein